MALPVLVRDSEPYSPRGNVASAGVSNQLGRPRLDPLAVFVREGVQNCWDAHLPDDPHIEVEVGLRTLTAGEIVTLRAQLLADPAPASPIAERLAAAEAGEPLRMLWLADRGTSGLGGPTRADAVAGTGGPTDFVDLLRNVGQPPDKPNGGGTFGYGKAALFRLSAVGVLLVHTHCKLGQRREARFMGVALGPQYTEPDDTGAPAHFTGRHWWGTKAADGIVDPVTGEAADDIAGALGLPAFHGDRCGTTMAILDPRLGDGRSPEDATRLIIEALLWNFWPKMIDGPDGRPPIRFRVLLDGASAKVPSPEDSPPLDGFVQALRHLDARLSEDGPALGHVVPIKRYTSAIGSLSLVRFPRVQRRKARVEEARLVGGIGDPACHVALMRSPRLIVQYAPHLPLQSDTWQFAGVFLVADDHDRPFAHAEPPTHDDWVATQLTDKRERSIVNVALREVGKEAMAFAHPTQDVAASARSEGLGPLSARLGQMLIGLGEAPEEATPTVRSSRPRVRRPTVDEDVPASIADERSTAGAEVLGPSAGSLRPAGRPSIRLLDGELVVHAERGALSSRFRLKHGIRTAGTRLRADCRATVEGGDREAEPPDGAQVPVVLAWIDPDGTLHPAVDDVVVAGPDQEGEWRVIVSLIDDASIDVSVRGEAVLADEERAG